MDHRISIAVVCLLFFSIGLSGSEPGRTRSSLIGLSKSYDLSSALETWHFHREPNSPEKDARFVNLIQTDARRAPRQPNQVLDLGRYVEEEPLPRAAIRFLLENGVPDANVHVMATVHLMSEGHDEQGYWCVLISEDDSWTNSHYRDTYDFGIRLVIEGTIRLVSANQLDQNHRDFVLQSRRDSGGRGPEKR